MTRRLVFLAVMCFTGAFAWSNPQDNSYTRISRLSYIAGNVSFQHSGEVDWSAASVNLPLEPGDRIYTGMDGRAEVEFDDGSSFRLAENTDVEILSLREELIQLRILIGLSTLSVSGNANFEIDTPVAAFNPVRDGIYRFDVIENGDTDAIVRKGELEAANNEFSQRIRSGELLHLSLKTGGTPEISQYDRRDEWDEWTDRRTADMRVYGNQRYLPDNVYVGAAELNQNGRWVNAETYGTAWVPYAVDASWSPYSVGRWCYRPFFGWTWISYEPWGWLPYHYGRWYRSPFFGWCWLPGPAFAFNFWSPGLVTFYSGPGWISWCPLGPGDYYDIGRYHYNRGMYGYQLAQLRGLHTRLPGDPFNREIRGAFRTAQLEQFRSGSFNSRSWNSRWGSIDKPWSQGTLVRDPLQVQPTSASFRAIPDRPAITPRSTSNLPAVVRNIPSDSNNRERFTRITNPRIPSAPSRTFRSRSEAVIETRPNPQVIQVSPNQRWPGSSGNSGQNNTRSREEQRTRPENAAPSNQQNSPKPRNERTAPERGAEPPPQQLPAGKSGERRTEFQQRRALGQCLLWICART